jgi:hypothetical protein
MAHKKKTDGSQPIGKSTIDRASGVAGFVDIYEIRLIEQFARVVGLTKKLPALRSDSRECKATRDNESGTLRVEASFAFKMAYETEESKKDPPVFIHAKFELVYKVKDISSFSDNDINAFGEVNGIYNAWPFWREFVYTTLSRMGLPPITLPVFRIVEANEDTKADKKRPK